MRGVELTVTVQDDSTVRAMDQGGREASGQVDRNRLHRETIKIFEDWLNQSKISKRRELEVLGAYLYCLLFNGDVEKKFEEALKSVPNGERLRVQLSFTEKAAELAGLPWEYLYYPDTETRPGFFLATDNELVLTRYMPLGVNRPPLEAEAGMLRILIVVSQPVALGPVAADQVIQEIQKVPSTAVDRLDQATLDNFLDELKSKKPHVLHFIGHGRFNKADKKGEIALLEADGQTERWIGDKEFTEYFRQMGWTPRLVFLHLCEGATVDFNANFAGLAPQLIRANVPAVVAMQYPISNTAAIAFSKAFYGELAKRNPIDHAVQVARWKITTDIPNAYDSRVFGTPVLYMQSRDGSIFPELPGPGLSGPGVSGPPGVRLGHPPGLPAGSVGRPPGLEERQMEPESVAKKEKTWEQLNILFYEGETRLDQADLSEAQEDAIKAELLQIHSEMKAGSSGDWHGIILNYYYEKKDRHLRAILKTLLDHLKQ